MSVQITFEPEGSSGLVAEGSYIWEAARRLGVVIPVECKGRGECDSCAVVIARGAELLAAESGAEVQMLGRERLDDPVKPERLACQTVLERPGEISVRLAPAREAEQGRTLRGLPFKDKVGALIELEAITVTEALNSLRSGYHSLIGKFLNLPPQTTKAGEQTTKEHQARTDESAGNDAGPG
jgi:ferredoxin